MEYNDDLIYLPGSQGQRLLDSITHSLTPINEQSHERCYSPTKARMSQESTTSDCKRKRLTIQDKIDILITMKHTVIVRMNV